MHITEESLAGPVTLFDRLRLNTARALATLDLLEERFIEPPSADGTMLSVLFQQILSRVKQGNGATFAELHRLVRACAVFDRVTSDTLRNLLGHLSIGDSRFLERAPDGAYILSERGEKLVYSPEFYAAFRTSATWEIISGGRRVGFVSLANPLEVGDTICLDGKSWQVTGFNFRQNKVSVVQGTGGRVPFFDPTGLSEVHERVAQAMRNTLSGEGAAQDLDAVAAHHLHDGRQAYARYQLSHRKLIEEADDCYLFSWLGTRFNKLLAKLLRSQGFLCEANEVAVLAASANPKDIYKALRGHLPSVADLSNTGSTPLQGKYDRRVPETLLREDWRRRHIDYEKRLHEFCRSAGQEEAIR
jgi:ATP-dependent Lhr-like helicase